MAFSSVLTFLLPTHSMDCAVHLLLRHSRALLVSSALFSSVYRANYALFLQFTALKCPFDGPFFSMAGQSLQKARTFYYYSHDVEL